MKRGRRRTVSLRMTVAMMAAVVVAFFAGTFVARATANGVLGGSSRNALSFAGTLSGADRTLAHTLTFRFVKGGGEQCAPTVTLGANSTSAAGAFQVEVPLDQAGHECPTTLFDGSDVTVNIDVDGTNVVSGGAINPVPYARYADQVGTSACPVGYERDPTENTFVLCQRPLANGVRDEVVRVGRGASAYWIDRYESAVNTNADGSGTWLFESDGSIGGLQRNGQWAGTMPPAFALSVRTRRPATFITWFQANEVCAASGKRLPQRGEWLRAAQGTPDPATGNDGTASGNILCHTLGGMARAAGLGAGCQSVWGAQDMIGNAWEWTDEWFAAPSSDVMGYPMGVWGDVGGTSYRGDGTAIIVSTATPASGAMRVAGLPVAAARGGFWGDGTRAGLFALLADSAPSRWEPNIGFRCVVPR